MFEALIFCGDLDWGSKSRRDSLVECIWPWVAQVQVTAEPRLEVCVYSLRALIFEFVFEFGFGSPRLAVLSTEPRIQNRALNPKSCIEPFLIS